MHELASVVVEVEGPGILVAVCHPRGFRFCVDVSRLKEKIMFDFIYCLSVLNSVSFN